MAVFRREQNPIRGSVPPTRTQVTSTPTPFGYTQLSPATYNVMRPLTAAAAQIKLNALEEIPMTLLVILVCTSVLTPKGVYNAQQDNIVLEE